METYSHSRISTFEQCPLRFKYNYIDKVELEVTETVEAFLGTRVHDALEKLYTDLKFEKLNTLQELLEYYNSEWEKNWNDNIMIVRKHYDQENYRKMGERYITDYYNRYKPFDQDKTIGMEIRILIDINGKKLQGYIDRLSTTGNGVYQVHDYKTSNTLPTQEQADTDRQLALYAIAVKERYQDCKQVELVWHYLAFDQDVRSRRTDQELEELKKDVEKLINQIEACEDFQPKESALCSWCEFRVICPRFKHLAEIEDKKPVEFKADDGVKLVNKYAELKLREKELNNEIEDLKNDILAFSEQKGMSKLYGSDAMVTVWSKECVKFPGRQDKDFQGFVELVKQQGLWDDFSTLDKFKLEKAFEKLEIDHDKMIPLSKFGRKEKITRLYLRTS